MTCYTRRGTPLNGLEIILDVPPIDLFIKPEAAKAAYRRIGTNDESMASKGHIKPQLDRLESLNLMPQDKDDCGIYNIW